MNFGKNVLKRLEKFTSDNLLLFDTKAITGNLKKDDVLLNEGVVCTSAFYIISGKAYQFSYKDIDESIIDPHIENN